MIINNKKEYYLLFLIILIAFTIRLHLINYRFLPEGDGCHYVALAKDFINGNFSTVGSHFIGWPLLIAVFAFILKNVEFSGRVASSLLGVFLIPVSYIIAKRLFNKKTALYVALAISTNLALLFYSSLLFTESAYALFVMLIALIGWISLKKKKLFCYFLLGLVVGISYTIRNEALSFTVLLLPLVIIRDYRKAHINTISFLIGI
jgi:4-amino-4-deoxy-L-arabinose transferase-like glycosyltransferase